MNADGSILVHGWLSGAKLHGRDRHDSRACDPLASLPAPAGQDLAVLMRLRFITFAARGPAHQIPEQLVCAVIKVERATTTCAPSVSCGRARPDAAMPETAGASRRRTSAIRARTSTAAALLPRAREHVLNGDPDHHRRVQTQRTRSFPHGDPAVWQQTRTALVCDEVSPSLPHDSRRWTPAFAPPGEPAPIIVNAPGRKCRSLD